MTQLADPSSTNGLGAELYKSLRTESASYVDKVPALWMQKFVLVGAVIAFLVTSPTIKGDVGGMALVSWGIAAIPFLAALIDLKILEYALHARAISRFIAVHFPSPQELGDWERCMWGDDGPENILTIVRVRSITTVLVTALPSIGLALLCEAVLYRINGQFGWLWGLTALFILCYVVGTVRACKAVLPMRRP